MAKSPSLSREDEQKWRKRITAFKQFYERELKPRFDEADSWFFGAHPRMWGMKNLVNDPTPFVNYRITKNYALTKKPKFFTRPRGGQVNNPYSEKAARACEYIADYFADELDLPTVVEELDQDVYRYGFGIAWLGYNAEFGEVHDRQQIFDPEVQALITQGRAYRCDVCGEIVIHEPAAEEPIGEPSGIGPEVPPVESPKPTVSCPQCNSKASQLKISDLESVVVESNEAVKRVMPHVFTVSPRDFIWDTSTGRNMKNPNWGGRRVWKRLDEVRANPYFKNTKNLKGTSFPTSEQPTNRQAYQTSASTPADEEKWIMLWEIWNRKITKEHPGDSDWELIVLADEEGAEGALVYDPDPWANFNEETGEWESYPLEGPPWVLVMANPINDRKTPLSELDIMRTTFALLDVFNTLALETAKRQVPVNKVRKGAIQAGTLERLNAAIPEEFVEVDDMNAIAPLEYSHLSQDVWECIQLLHARARLAQGVSENMQLSKIPGATATEAKIISSGAELNLQARVWCVEYAYTHIIRKLIQIVRHFWTNDIWVRMSPENIPMKITRDMIQAEVEFSVEVGSTTPASDAVRQQQLMTFLKIVMSYPGANVKPLIKTIGNAFGIQDVDRIVPPDTEPNGPEVEFALMAAGFPVPPTQSGNIGRHVQVEMQMLSNPLVQQAFKAMPQEVALQRLDIIQQHIKGEQAILSGQQVSLQKTSSEPPPGPPEGGQDMAAAQNVTYGQQQPMGGVVGVGTPSGPGGFE